MNTDHKKLAHDLRNELGTIANYAQVLELSLDKKEGKNELEVTREILAAIKKMDALITEVLDKE